MKNILLIAIAVLLLGACSKPVRTSIPSESTPSRNKFLGNWNVTEKGAINASAQYPLSITQTSAGTEGLLINNFYNILKSVSATVVGDSIYIPDQKVNGYEVFGAGYIGSGASGGQYTRITMSYEVIDSNSVLVGCYGYNGKPQALWGQ